MPVRKKQGVPIPAGGLAAVPAPTLPPSHPVPFIRQEQTQWCWAACTAMIAGWLRPSDPVVKQCELAGRLVSRKDCCKTKMPAVCNSPCPERLILAVYASEKIAGVGERNPLTPQEVLYELTTNGPVEVGYYWLGGGGHVVIVYGLTAAGLYAVHDPWFGSGYVTYNALRTAYGRGLWVLSFGQFKAQG